ncbi:MAG TPA: molybdenum cofactor guanylyltransferase [Gammaproteobacteria bacterium]|nr:molybdenum cofactor guanylyltransferase [Gammaproteobacteria bacterium]
MYSHNDVTAIVLAGGLGRRVNYKNKGLLKFAGQPLITHVLEKLKTQTPHILINANHDLSDYQTTGYPVIQDQFPGNQGPLAGILSSEPLVNTQLVLTLPCDVPLLPQNLLMKMLASYEKKSPGQLCVAHDGHRLQNLFLLFETRQLKKLRLFFEKGNRRVADWIHSQPYSVVDFSDEAANFVNINSEKALITLNQTRNCK